MKSNKKIIGVGLVIILIALLFFFFQKSQQDSASNSKDNPTTSSEALNGKDSSGDEKETAVGETEAASGKPGSGETTAEGKGNDKIAEDNGNKQGVTVYTSPANFGSTAEVVIDGSKFKNDYKYYQYYVSNKPVSNIESITKLQTTIFPAVEAGSQVELHLFDETQKEINKIDIKLIEKK